MSNRYDEHGSAVFLEDDFDEMEAFGRDNRGAVLNQGADIPPWRALSTGKTIGKSADLVDGAGGANIVSNTDILEINSDDGNALQLSVIFAPPMVTRGIVNGAFTDNVDSGIATTYTYGNPIAIVEWGLGSSRNKAEVDILNGFAMNLGGCSFVRLRAQIEVVGVARTAMTYRFSAAVNPGRVKNTGASRTVGIGSMLAALPSPLFALPRFARQVSVHGFAAIGTVFVGTVRFFLGNNAGVGVGPTAEYTFAANAPNSVWVPIPNGSYFCQIVSAADMDNVGVVFDLAI